MRPLHRVDRQAWNQHARTVWPINLAESAHGGNGGKGAARLEVRNLNPLPFLLDYRGRMSSVTDIEKKSGLIVPAFLTSLSQWVG